MPARTLAAATLGAGEYAVAGSRHRHIEEPARSLRLAARCRPHRRAAWQLRVLDAEDVDARELEALRRMQRQQVDALTRQRDAVFARQRHAFEKLRDLVT